MTKEHIEEGKTLAIISYLTFIGTFVAVFMNFERKNAFTNFHLRQMIGLIIMLILSNVVEKYVNSMFGSVLWAVTFLSWLYSIIFAIKGEAKLIPVVGEKFQQWFKDLGN
ncbi:hypothetical protein [Lacinutrix mariniflava]|uniref:hypothetical protein n=1 Tax=Lacinutrix mariniflava TaxID=342955 RepID=UPI0006E25AA4|nr:hypothetical protein [Lacinutrix mariniflava]